MKLAVSITIFPRDEHGDAVLADGFFGDKYRRDLEIPFVPRGDDFIQFTDAEDSMFYVDHCSFNVATGETTVFLDPIIVRPEDLDEAEALVLSFGFTPDGHVLIDLPSEEDHWEEDCSDCQDDLDDTPAA